MLSRRVAVQVVSIARGCARIDSGLDTAKIGSDGRRRGHRARLLAVIEVRKTFPHGLGSKAVFPTPKPDFRYPPGSGHCSPAVLSLRHGYDALCPGHGSD
jgi:hypothetical protein